MNFERRMLIQNLGAGALGFTLAGVAAPAMAAEDVKVVPLTDDRVQQFLRYRTEVKKDAMAAISQYTVPNFTYVSTAGQSFDREGLAHRIEHWAKGFTVVSSEADWAVSIGASELLIATTDVIVHSGEFRGHAATNAKVQVDSFFLISYADDGKFAKYTRYSNYGAVAEAIGSKQLAALHGL